MNRLFHLLWLLVLSSGVFAADLSQAQRLFAAGDPTLGSLLQQRLHAEPQDLQLNLLKIRLDVATGEHEAAVQRAEQLVQQASDSAEAHLRLADAYAANINQVGRWAQMRMAGRLRDALQQALALDPKLIEAHEGLLLYYLQAPWIAGGSVDRAEEHAIRIAALDRSRGLAAQARVLAARDQLEAAASYWQRACRQRGMPSPVCMDYGYFLQQQARWDEAFALFRQWTTEAPDDAAAWYQLGRSSALSGREATQGIAALQHYLALPTRFDLPAAQHAWFRLGQIHASSGDAEAARQAWQQSLLLDPSHIEARTALDGLASSRR